MSTLEHLTSTIVARNLGKRYRVTPSGAQRLLRRKVNHHLGDDEDGWVWALRHVDLDVRPGEMVGVVGRNGSGKTTLLKLLARVTVPTIGRALIRGRVTALLAVGAGFHPHFTGRENIALNAAIMGLGPDELAQRFDAMVEFSEVGRYIDEPVKHYSSGMYARLAFSVAAHLPAEVMLVDEVLAVGDATFHEKAQERMVASLKDGRAVVYVGHSVGAVREMCARAIVLDRGQVAFFGPAQDAVEFYQQEIVERARLEDGTQRRSSTG